MPPGPDLLKSRPIRRIALLCHPPLGDTVHLGAVADWLKHAHPDAKLTVFTSTLSKPLWDICPLVDEVKLREGNRFKILRELRAGGFDLSIITYSQNTMTVLSWLAGIPIRLGVEGKYSRLLTATVPNRRLGHFLFAPLQMMLEPYGVDCSRRNFAFDWDRLPPFDPGVVAPRGWVGLQFHASHFTKDWPLDRYVEVARALGEDGWTVGWVGSKADASSLEGVDLPPGSVLLAGETSILQLISFLRQCRLMVTNDTGPMHMAGAVGTPVVAIYGPSDAANDRPPGEGHVTFQGTCRCPIHNQENCKAECIKTVGVEEVLDACRASLSRSPRES